MLCIKIFKEKKKKKKKKRDLKITHPVRLRRFRLKFNGIGRHGFNQQKKVAKIRLRRGFILLAAPDHDSPEKGLSAPETKRFLWW